MSIDDDFNRYVLPHTALMMQIAYALLAEHFKDHAKDEAKDVVQVIQIIAWQKWETIEARYEEQALKKWLLTSVRRECYHRLAAHRPISLDEIDVTKVLFEAFPGSTQHIHTLELRESIKRLPYPYGLIIFARNYQGLSFQEIAEEFRVDINHMYKLYARSLVLLKRELELLTQSKMVKKSDRLKGEGHD